MDIKQLTASVEPRRVIELFRFYQAAALNALFGFSLYALLVAMGLNIYLAQILSHTTGVAFNYFTYSRHAFRGSAPAKVRFIGVYTLSYVIGLGSLAVIANFVQSPYAAGLAALVIASVINYFALKYLVFFKSIES
jgi:putative flippase GtrA